MALAADLPLQQTLPYLSKNQQQVCQLFCGGMPSGDANAYTFRLTIRKLLGPCELDALSALLTIISSEQYCGLEQYVRLYGQRLLATMIRVYAGLQGACQGRNCPKTPPLYGYHDSLVQSMLGSMPLWLLHVLPRNARSSEGQLYIQWRDVSASGSAVVFRIP